MYVDWGPPHLSLVVCYILHLIIPLPCKTWYYKKCNTYTNLVLDVIRTLGTSNQTILQPPKYFLIVNRSGYANNSVTKDRYSILMDTTVMFGPLRFSLRATIDYHGPSVHSGHYTASFLHSIATATKLRLSLKLLITKTPLPHMLYFINWLIMSFELEQGGGSLITPSLCWMPLVVFIGFTNCLERFWDGERVWDGFRKDFLLHCTVP